MPPVLAMDWITCSLPLRCYLRLRSFADRSAVPLLTSYASDSASRSKRRPIRGNETVMRVELQGVSFTGVERLDRIWRPAHTFAVSIGNLDHAKSRIRCSRAAWEQGQRRGTKRSGRRRWALADYGKGAAAKANELEFKFCGYFEPGALPLFRKVPSRSSVKAC